jgi:hypothetical protein
MLQIDRGLHLLHTAADLRSSNANTGGHRATGRRIASGGDTKRVLHSLNKDVK